ncbi:hypothetical protein HDU77_005488 [Chytriomyces hyalinus]|nr:hypothetical protein HDU77_005488 [Chytriomyces hyalinus]
MVSNPTFQPVAHPLDRKFVSFTEFYPFYLGEHKNRTSRRLHFIGTGTALGITATALITGRLHLLLYVPFAGYGFAWLGHFMFEKNRPATFTYPVWSLLGDFTMFFETVTGKRAL